ncbi:hypothetical protein [Pseudomonas coleopterorum]|uniref:hypothetical protein n=1 Tax=Pseudomonas coleopterorum TaxID=1605838 RepID=UPI0028AB7305|nr:hypothetical protein [Pseudomonas coleopterorum]
MPGSLQPSETAQWFAVLGLGDAPNYSVISITLSNEPIERWFYKRNKLRPESLMLHLTASRSGSGESNWNGMTSYFWLNGALATTCE